MITKIIICVILLIIAGSAKGFMDTLQFHYYEMRWKLPNQYWNPEVSWQNKYHVIRPWNQSDSYFKIYLLKFGRWLFMNPLVFVTDGWHLMQFICLNATTMVPAILQPYYNPFLAFLVIRAIFGILFSLFYNYILIKHEKNS